MPEHPATQGGGARFADEPEQLPAANGDDSALSRMRAQLQATARVHQRTLVQVAALRERNNTLARAVERLQAAEAEAQTKIQVLEGQKQGLEHELEPLKTGTFTWLRRLFW